MRNGKFFFPVDVEDVGTRIPSEQGRVAVPLVNVEIDYRHQLDQPLGALHTHRHLRIVEYVEAAAAFAVRVVSAASEGAG